MVDRRKAESLYRKLARAERNARAKDGIATENDFRIKSMERERDKRANEKKRERREKRKQIEQQKCDNPNK
jgi:hypothetical protein